MSEPIFLIQVRVNQKWSTAHGLSSEKTLKKFLPKLEAEHGESIRALRASRDTSTGKTKWSVYRCPENRRVDTIPEPRTQTQPCAMGPFTDSNAIEINEHWGITHPYTVNGSAVPLQDDDTSGRSEVVRRGPRGYRLAGYKNTFRKWIIASSIVGARYCVGVVGACILHPLAIGGRFIINLVRGLAAQENKVERLRLFTADTLSRLEALLRKPAAQWACCAILIFTGLFAAYRASFAGGLTVAVLAIYLIPPVRRSALATGVSKFSPAANTVFAFLLLVASGWVEIVNPDRRETNGNINYFQIHQAEIIASAQSSLDRAEYLTVVSLLDRFLPAGNDEVSFLYEQARPFADVELARQEKIATQFSYNGSNRYLTDHIIRTMTDPGSYRHVKTNYRIKDEYLEVETTFRGLNEVGTLFTKTVRAVVDFDGRVIHES